MASLAATFLGALPVQAREAEKTPTLEGELAAACERAEEAHPGVALPRETFVRALAERTAEREVPWRDVVLADLYLAVACLAGDKHALRAFEGGPIAELARKLGRQTLDRELVEATIRNVRESMFVGTEKRRPKLAVYTGQVPIAAWLFVVGKRELASVARKKPRELPTRLGVLEDSPSPHDPELYALLRAHRGAFQDVIAKVMGALAPADRELLRWTLKEGHAPDRIAPELGVDRATVYRRLARVRARLEREVERELRAKLRLGTETFDSLCAKMMPELDVSLSRIL